MSNEQILVRRDGANNIVSKYMKWSAGAGIIPVPILDSLAVSVVQIKMLKSLANHYGLKFKGEIVKSLIASLLGGLSSNVIAYGVIGKAAKAIPGIGTLFGMVAMPVSSAAVCYALGSVFIKHFEMGGTFFDFDPDSTREHFRDEFAKAKAGETVQNAEVVKP